jgi:squalene-hopene/tetraprenyl-beta-curcumene cyclase
VIALRESGLPADHLSLIKAAHWLLKEEIHVGGDWQVKNPRTKPGGWAFEFENDLYPDIDDTAVVSRALLKMQLADQEEKAKIQAVERGLRWVMSMQSSDGGWAAFDLNNNKEVLAHIPFADFMTPIDPPSPDVTAHAIELMGDLGRRRSLVWTLGCQLYLWYRAGSEQLESSWREQGAGIYSARGLMD